MRSTPGCATLDEKLETSADEPYAFLCECGNNTCTERIQITVPEYERIHADPARFVIVPGHQKPEIEEVVEEHEGYSVIRKRDGGPAELAAEHAPSA